MPEKTTNDTTYGGKYGKRPLWQWILIYLVVGGVIYLVVYYFIFAKKGGYSYPSSGQSSQQYNKTPST